VRPGLSAIYVKPAISTCQILDVFNESRVSLKDAFPFIFPVKLL
jgi:hypothetical protein